MLPFINMKGVKNDKYMSPSKINKIIFSACLLFVIKNKKCLMVYSYFIPSL